MNRPRPPLQYALLSPLGRAASALAGLALLALLWVPATAQTGQASSATATTEATARPVQALSGGPTWAGPPVPNVAQGGAAGPKEARRPATALAPGAGTRIAFQSYRDGNWEIYLVAGDGSEPFRITNNLADDLDPRLDRHAARVAFASGQTPRHDIYVANADGSGARALTAAPGDYRQPAWSPDGTRLAFAASPSGAGWQIYTINADGTALHAVTTGSVADTAPAWSPDGTRLAWVRETGLTGAVWIANADGSSPHAVLTSLHYPHPELASPHVGWSPDGTKLAVDNDGDADGWLELYTAAVDGTNFTRIYDVGTARVDALLGSWSPDGAYLLFARVAYMADLKYIASAGIYYCAATPGAPASALPGSDYDMAPDWQSVDAMPPIAHVDGLPALARLAGFVLRWSGQDPDPGSGIAAFEVQYREPPDTAWTTWQAWTTATSAAFPGEAGHTYDFRARARDNAANVQAWNGDEVDTRTQFYTWQVSGSVRDTRARPIPDSPLTAQPPLAHGGSSDRDGKFELYLGASGPQGLLSTNNAFGVLPPLALSGAADASAVLVLPPPADGVQNGGFESGALAPVWDAFGALRPRTDAGSAHTGVSGAMLAASLDVNPASTPLAAYAPKIAAGADGTVHAVGVTTGAGDFTFLHTSRVNGADWSTPAAILQFPATLYNISYAIAADGAGGIDLAWSADDGGDPCSVELFTCHLAVGDDACGPIEALPQPGVCSSPQYPSVARDATGELHLAWQSVSEGIYYARRPVGEVWTAAEVIPGTLIDGYAGDVSLGVDGAGNVHAAWLAAPTQEQSYYVKYAALDAASGVWSATETVGNTAQWSYPRLAVSAEGTAHVIYEEMGDSLWYATRPAGAAGGWSVPERLSRPGEIPFQESHELEVDAFGAVHVIYGTASPARLAYMVRGPTDTSWQDAVLPLNASPRPISFAVDGRGLAHILYNEAQLALAGQDARAARVPAGTSSRAPAHPAFAVGPGPAVPSAYYATPIAAQPGTPGAALAGLAQRVTVPAQNPTLALLARSQLAWLPDGLAIQVGNGVTTTVPCAVVPLDGSWRLAWADLSPWAGQELYLAVSIMPEAGRPLGRVDIDEVSLGPWLTPIVEGVDPKRLSSAATGSRLTITGSNFLPTPTASLGALPLADVEWQSATSLVASLPPTLGPGLYDLWVWNPGGQAAVLPAALRVGTQVFLPMVTR